MEDKELLQAISSMMDMKLEPIILRLDKLEQGQSRSQKDMQSIKHDVKEIAWKVDTLYDWVDNVELKMNRIDDRTK